METLKKNDPAKAKQYFAAKIECTTDPYTLAKNLKESADINVVDVREAGDYAKGHVPGAINLPAQKWQSLTGLRKDALNVLYCYNQQCHLAARAACEFAGKGFPVMELDGGFEAWKEHDLEIESDITPQNRWKNHVAVSA